MEVRKMSSSKQDAAAAAARRHGEEFKRDAVRLVTDEGCGEDAPVDELRGENKRLKRELRRAELEREILKKATAYFAKESL
jgi:transposase-like protein